MQIRRTALWVAVGGACLTMACANRPPVRPKILSSYAPPGAGQPVPLNSKAPIAVPTGVVGGRAPAAVAVPVQPGVAVPAQPAVAVPAQPGVAVPAQPGVAVPAQPGAAVPAQPAPAPQQPSLSAPTNSQQYSPEGSASTRQPDPAARRPLTSPPPGNLYGN